MTRQQAVNTVSAFTDSIISGPKVLGAGVAIVTSALWSAFDSVLATVLAVLFLADVVLGSFKAVHKGGLGGFDWEKFWRAWIKMGAAIVGIALFSVGDTLLHQTGHIPVDWMPLTSAALAAMCWGFFSSALVSFGYFFPDAQKGIEAIIEKAHTKKGDE